MIGLEYIQLAYYQSIVSKAQSELNTLTVEINGYKKELEKCVQLKPILIKIEENAMGVYRSLQTAGNSLNNGIKINGVGQGNKILDRAKTISDLNSKASVAKGNVEKRIRELEEQIETIETRISSLENTIQSNQAKIYNIKKK